MRDAHDAQLMPSMGSSVRSKCIMSCSNAALFPMCRGPDALLRDEGLLLSARDRPQHEDREDRGGDTRQGADDAQRVAAPHDADLVVGSGAAERAEPTDERDDPCRPPPPDER